MKTRHLLILLSITLGLFVWSCTDPAEDDTTPPASPSNLDRDGSLTGDGEIYLIWDENTENDLATYTLYRSIDGTDFPALVSTPENFYLDTGLDYNTEYSYKLTATDDDGNESGFSTELSVTPINLDPPAQPTDFAAQAHNTSEFDINVSLTWTHNTETDFSHYKVYRSDVSDLFATNESSYLDSTPSNHYTDNDVTPGTSYHYKLIAFDRGDFTSSAAGPATDIPLIEPTLISPIGGDTIDSLTPTFHWTNVDGAVKYTLTVRTSAITGDKWVETLDATTDAQMSATFPSNHDDPLLTNTLYYWFVSGYSKDTESINVFTDVNAFRTP